jgi:hypothetical protein
MKQCRGGEVKAVATNIQLVQQVDAHDPIGGTQSMRRPWRRLLAVMALAIGTGGISDVATPAHAARVLVSAAAGVPGAGAHGLGFQLSSRAAHLSMREISALARMSMPAVVDLSRYDPPVGEQGQVASGTAWATGYYLRGWYARRDGHYPSGGFEPMFTYAQIVHGQNIGTSIVANLNIQKSTGICARAVYTQGDFDYTTQPTGAEVVNASQYKLMSYSDVANPPGGLQHWIEASMAAGNPVVIAIPVGQEFEWVGAASNYLVNPQGPRPEWLGDLALFASKYDANGVWIENSWGTSWGLNGWAELSWSYINQYAFEAANIVP